MSDIKIHSVTVVSPGADTLRVVRCELCKWWAPPEREIYRDKERILRACEHPELHKETKNGFGTPYGDYGDWDGHVNFICGPDFGCVRGEKKEPPNNTPLRVAQ